MAGPDHSLPKTPIFIHWIGLGSNIGETRATLLAACAAIASLGQIRAASSLWQSEPVGPITGQPSFLNAVLTLETQLPPEQLLDALLSIERAHGRDRSAQIPQGPRTLDLDLLLTEKDGRPILLAQPGLTLPHPQLARRRFVLAPMAEISPATRHPSLHQTVAELLAALPEEGPNAPAAVTRVGALTH
jgi:2-amino-4-hydroxy-6-hydroxymethyldihydropteridine diphosphokinase